MSRSKGGCKVMKFVELSNVVRSGLVRRCDMWGGRDFGAVGELGRVE
jgi:hypothetical protein